MTRTHTAYDHLLLTVAAVPSRLMPGHHTPSISVCIATFNGEMFVREQLRSILAEFTSDDELIIVDDASTDDTVAVIENLNDDRVTLLRNLTNEGYVRAFQTALAVARNDFVLLADQDDVWLPGHRRFLVEALESAAVAASNLLIMGTNQPPQSPISRRPWVLRKATSKQRVRNQLRIWAGIAPYFGCAMGIRRDFLDKVLPFPTFLSESHDLWIATLANAAGSLTHVEAPTLLRRLHGLNASARRPRDAGAVLAARLMLLRCTVAAVRRTRTR